MPIILFSCCLEMARNAPSRGPEHVYLIILHMRVHQDRGGGAQNIPHKMPIFLDRK